MPFHKQLTVPIARVLVSFSGGGLIAFGGGRVLTSSPSIRAGGGSWLALSRLATARNVPVARQIEPIGR